MGRTLSAARHYVDDHGALDRTQRHLPCEELSVARLAVVVVREAVAAIQSLQPDLVPEELADLHQHTCALNSESVQARVTWATPQGHRAGHSIKEPCTRLDLCAGVSCPAIDECHTEGVCVAGLCTTPKKEGACGVTAFVAQPVLAAAAECPGAVEVDALSLAIPDRKEKCALAPSTPKALEAAAKALAA